MYEKVSYSFPPESGSGPDLEEGHRRCELDENEVLETPRVGGVPVEGCTDGREVGSPRRDPGRSTDWTQTPTGQEEVTRRRATHSLSSPVSSIQVQVSILSTDKASAGSLSLNGPSREAPQPSAVSPPTDRVPYWWPPHSCLSPLVSEGGLLTLRGVSVGVSWGRHDGFDPLAVWNRRVDCFRTGGGPRGLSTTEGTQG